ncbi:MAG: hypothetical protein L3K14_05205 [Thermoplasmata archaeon]|nr:hypothetical protein [Thermoplasmata archaeon]
MPRFKARVARSTSEPPVEFDLCARCAADGEILRTVVSGKMGIPIEGLEPPPVDQIAHRSYDFQPRPTPCISCARILSSEDD